MNERYAFCKDGFWDNNLTWNTDLPDFTNCFQQSIFVLVPCGIFVIAAVIYVLVHWKSPAESRLPWSLLCISKIVISALLLLCSFIEIGAILYKGWNGGIDIYASFTKSIAYITVICLLIYDHSHGKKSSSLMSIFWFVLMICGIFTYRSTLIRAFREEHSDLSYREYILESISFPLILCQFFFTLFSEPTVPGTTEAKNPIEETPFFSFVTFAWFSRIMYEGAKKLFTVEDFPPLPKKIKAQYLWKTFLTQWPWSDTTESQYKANDATAITSTIAGADKSPKPRQSLLSALVKSFWPWLTRAVLLGLADVVTLFFPTLLLDLIISFMSNDDYLWKGIMYILVLCSIATLRIAVHNVAMFYAESFALQLKSTVISAIYRKSLKLDNSARQEYTSGEIVNLMTADTEKVSTFFCFCINLVGSPLKIVISVFLLWLYLGPSCLAGFVALLLLIGMSSFIMKTINAVQVKQMEKKDTRLKFITEVLNGIKVLKLYAWEIPFMNRLNAIRDSEVYFIRKFQLYFAVGTFVWGFAPFLIAVACFVTYTLVDPRNILDPNTVFVSLNLLNILRFAVLQMPDILGVFIQALVSLKRLNAFLNAEEKDEDLVGNNPGEGNAVSLKDATFSWDPSKDNPLLKDITMNVPKGSFVAVIGTVGSGKSSLLSAILGDMYKSSGSVDIMGSMAYVPQQAWILNRTVKQNILFVKNMEKAKYNAVLDSCCLRPDLEILPGGDNTEIGEKGVNLSGGQKQRVSLARAVYHDAEVYLLDDPLSAVDAHVGKHIFEHIIGKNGMLRNKTRILVTHSMTVLPEADCIYVIKNGKIVERGTYDELTAKIGGVLAEIIQDYSNLAQAEVDDEFIAEPLLSESGEMPVSPRPLTERTISVRALKRRNTSVCTTANSEHGIRLMEDEKMEIGKVKREAYINYAKQISYPIVFCGIIGYFGYQALEIGGNIWLSKWSTDPVFPDGTQDVDLRNKRIGVYATFGFCQGLAILFGAVSIAIGTSKASSLFHKQMVHSIMRAPTSFFDTTPLGRIINRFGKDIDDIDVGIPFNIKGFIAMLCSTLATFVVIGISTPIFLAFLVPIGVPYYLIQRLYLMTSRQLKRLVSVTRSPIYSHLSETIQGLSSIKAYRVSREFILKAEESLDKHILCEFFWNISSRWLEMRMNFLGVLVILVAGLLAVTSRGTVTGAVAGLSLTYALSVNEILNWLVRSSTELENKSVAVERVDEYSKLPSEAEWVVSDVYPPKSWPNKGVIKFKDYSTRYREGLNLVLRDVNVAIKEGEKVGIVGRTGAGKSSFTLALFRIIEPVSGTIDIDTVDISQIGLHQLRSKLTIIPQDPVLFTGPLRTNLDPNEEYTDDALWCSLEQASLKSYVSSLPEKLDHEVAEGGSNLSVGQRQLVCLARALLKKTRILILDEATAAVDVETDSFIQNTIREEFKTNTVITIAHRLNTIMDYDTVVVMESGTVVESGNPSELLKNPASKFYEMAKDAGYVN